MKDEDMPSVRDDEMPAARYEELPVDSSTHSVGLQCFVNQVNINWGACENYVYIS